VKDKGEDKDIKHKSYFAAKRRRLKRNLMITTPICIVVIGIAVGLMYMGGPTVQSNKMMSHNHIQLNVTLNGQPLQVPSGIGIKQTGFGENLLLYGDHSLDQFGMEGMSPLHTHDDNGLIHVESNTVKVFTLGQFLNIWRGLDVDDKNVKATVNDELVSDFRNIALNDGEKIKLDIVS
jgi:hypothetical protein